MICSMWWLAWIYRGGRCVEYGWISSLPACTICLASHWQPASSAYSAWCCSRGWPRPRWPPAQYRLCFHHFCWNCIKNRPRPNYERLNTWGRSNWDRHSIWTIYHYIAGQTIYHAPVSITQTARHCQSKLIFISIINYVTLDGPPCSPLLIHSLRTFKDNQQLTNLLKKIRSF